MTLIKDPDSAPARRLAVGLMIICVFASGSAAAAEEPLDPQAQSVLRRALDAFAAQARNGGWPSAWSVDRRMSWGQKGLVPASWITIQPPATPDVGLVYLEAARVLDEPVYLQVARRAHDAILKLQTPDGGFVKEGLPTLRAEGPATLDDDVTTAALRFFIALFKHTQSPQDRATVERIGAFLLTAQDKSGGWPQRYPLIEDHYSAHITFNDDVMANVIHALLDLYALLDDDRYLQAAIRGGECVIRLQGGPGEEIWAQQYDRATLKPAPGRPFELAGYTPNESVEVCDALVALYFRTAEERFLTPVARALAWYDRNRLPNGKWARLYEPGTRRPIYGLAQGGATYELNQARLGYSWQGEWYPHRAKRAYENIRVLGLQEARRGWGTVRRRVPDVEHVRSICAELSSSGLWLTPASVEQRAALKAADGATRHCYVVESAQFCERASDLLAFLDRK